MCGNVTNNGIQQAQQQPAVETVFVSCLEQAKKTVSQGQNMLSGVSNAGNTGNETSSLSDIIDQIDSLLSRLLDKLDEQSGDDGSDWPSAAPDFNDEQWPSPTVQGGNTSQNMIYQPPSIPSSDSADGVSGVSGAGASSGITVNGDGSVSALDGAVTVTGHNAEYVAGKVEELYESSPTFKAMVDKAVAEGEKATINTEISPEGGSSGLSSLGAEIEEVSLRMDKDSNDETYLAFISHELGHAFGNYDDGEGTIGSSIGSNQHYNAQVGYEMGYLDTPQAVTYGTLWG